MHGAGRLWHNVGNAERKFPYMLLRNRTIDKDSLGVSRATVQWVLNTIVIARPRWRSQGRNIARTAAEPDVVDSTIG